MAEDPARQNGLKAAATVKEHLAKVGWDPQETEEEAVYRVDFSADKIPVAEALAKVRVDVERFIFLLNFRDPAPADQRASVAEFITRANSGLVIGNFEMSYDDGKVAFKSSVDFTGSELTPRLVRNAIRSAMDVVEYYGDHLVDVVRGQKTALAAIEAAEA